ncbi:MAG TPA: tetratricopeptide repeat protein [Kofleriaceae bacterium]
MVARVAGVAVLLISSPAIGDDRLEPDDLPDAQAEVARDAAAIDLPAVPAFDLPAAPPGEHRPRELKVHGKRLLDTAVKVRGHVTWIYDCEAELKRVYPPLSRQQLHTAIDRDPTLCSQPKFYLGDARDADRDRSIWVADVPPQLKLELGDRVVVTGTWATTSPHVERNTEGLLVFGSLERIAPGAVEPAVASLPGPAAEAEVTVVTTPPMRKVFDEHARNVSVTLLNACNKAIAARRYNDAITECRAATGIWDGNHLAWYAWASAHLARSEWQAAGAAIARAVALRPDRAMYQLYDGIARYEAAIQKARDDAAQARHRRPDEVALDPSRLALDDARDALRRAVRLMPGLWRAHYYLGRLYRDLEDAGRAAEQFTAAIAGNPAYHHSYIALCELYRRWGYLDQALAVALRGTERVRPTEAADLWFEVGLTYDARHLDDKAIAAFGKVLDTRPRDANARFQRGQIYFRKGNFGDARLDLEDVIKSSDPRLAALQPIAQQLLHQMAVQDQLAHQPRPRPAGRTVERLDPPRQITP